MKLNPPIVAHCHPRSCGVRELQAQQQKARKDKLNELKEESRQRTSDDDVRLAIAKSATYRRYVTYKLTK